MPWRSRLMASTRSSRSVVSAVCWASTSRSSSSARRLTAPSRSRSRRSFSRFSSISSSGGNSAPGSISASPATACGSTSSMSWISRSTSARRRRAPSMRSSARAVASRALDSASSEILAARSVSAITVLGGGQRVGGDAAIGFGGFDFADQRAALFREDRRRIVEFGALGRDLGDAGFDGRDLRGRAGLAVLPFVALGRDRLQAAVRQFRLARQRLRFGPHLRGERGDGRRSRCGRRRVWFRSRGSAAIRRAPRRRSHGRRRASVRSAVEAAVRLGQRRFARGVAIDLALGRRHGVRARRRPRAARRARHRARRSRRSAAAFSSASALSSACRLVGGIDAGLLQLVFDIDQSRALGEPPRRAGRRMGGGDESVPAPDVAFAATPAAGRSSAATPVPRRALARRRRSGRGAAPVPAAPRHGPRAASTPSGSAGSPSVDAAHWSSASARTGSTGASRSSPSAAPSAFS